MKKKLLYVVESFGGGVFSFLSELSKLLLDNYDITIAHSMRKETPVDFEKYFPENVKFIALENFSREINIKKDLRALKEIKEIVKEISPDIVHLHSTKAGAIGRLALSFSKHPYKLYYTPHNYSFFMQDTGAFKRLIYRAVEKICALGNAVTIACSEFEYSVALKLRKNAKVVCNGINTELIDDLISKNKSTSKDCFTVCTLGRITGAKNPELFSEIARKLPKISFVWIGDGEERSCLIGENITVTGWLSKEAALKKLIQCDVFILPSLWESLSLSLLEAMYAGALVVASDIEGNRGVVTHKENGFLANEADEYVEIINNIKNNNIDNEQICQFARRTVSHKYTALKMKIEYMKIYE